MSKEIFSENMLSELANSKAERLSEKEHTEREKNVFAEELKKSIGAEMKKVLSEKKKNDETPKKKGKIKEFFEKLARVCQ